MKKNYKFYYILGGSLCLFAVLFIIFSLSLTLIFPGNQIVGWVGFGLTIIGIVIVFFSIFLLKKGNYLKLNTLLEKKDNEKNEEKK